MKRLLLLSLLLWLPSFGKVKLVTYNIRQDTRSDRGVRDWSSRAPGLLDYLKTGGFSIIGLQEAHHHQVEFIEKGLAGFGRIGVGRSDGKTRGEYSPILFDSRKWRADPEDQGTFWLSPTPEVPGSTGWGNKVTRICTWVRLLDGEGQGIYVFNTHWDHESQPSREKAAVLILKRIRERKQSDDPVVLMGDFNATTENPAIKALLEPGLVLHPEARPQKVTYNFWKQELKDGLAIDHHFITPTLRKGARLEVQQDGDPVNSDHHPVVLILPGREERNRVE